MDYEDARAAYPLISMHDASISLNAWLRFAKRLCRGADGRTGLMAVRDRREIIHALYSYRVLPDLNGGQKLSLSNLIVAQFPGLMIEDVITASANDLAARFRCRLIMLEHRFGRLSSHPAVCPTVKALLSDHAFDARTDVRH